MGNDIEHQKAISRARRTKQRARDRAIQIEHAIANIDKGIGFSSAKLLAILFNTTEKTIFCWSADDRHDFPRQVKLSSNMSRWENKKVKAYRDKLMEGNRYV